MFLFLGLGVLFAACASPEPPRAVPMGQVLPESPLPPCPDKPNCVRETRLFDTSADTLFSEAELALQAMGAGSIAAKPGTRRIDAVFTAFLFKDDVAVAVAPHQDGAVLHIRSASRVGRSDFGVNGRRVRDFFQQLADRL